MDRIGASPHEAARICGIRAQHVYTFIASGLLESHAVGRKSVVWIDELRALITAQPPPKSPRRTASENNHVSAAG